MTSLMVVAIANMCVRLFIAFTVSYALIRFSRELVVIERMALGLAGGSAFMTLAPIYGSVERIQTPFDQWSGLLFSLSVAALIAFRLFRAVKHEWRNEAQRKESYMYLRGRGKIS